MPHGHRLGVPLPVAYHVRGESFGKFGLAAATQVVGQPESWRWAGPRETGGHERTPGQPPCAPGSFIFSFALL